MTSGDIYWIEFPGGAGRAQAGRRPAILLQAKEATEKLPTVLVVPFATQQDALRFPGTLLVRPTRANGLHRPSIAMLFQLTVVDKAFLSTRIGTLSTKDMAAIWEAFDQITERPD